MAALLRDEDATCRALTLSAFGGVSTMLAKVVVMRLHRAKRLDSNQPLTGRCSPTLLTALHGLIDAAADAVLKASVGEPDLACRGSAAVACFVKVCLFVLLFNQKKSFY